MWNPLQCTHPYTRSDASAEPVRLHSSARTQRAYGYVSYRRLPEQDFRLLCPDRRRPFTA